MEVLQLTATRFIKPMSTGRNRPLLLGCEGPCGDELEVVVKFRGREMTEKSQCSELIAAQLADDLGLQAPQAAVVDVQLGFEAIIPEKGLAEMVKNSPGSNFGSVHLGAGFTTWPPGRAPFGAQRDQAAEIFAFDVLAQNPDRRAGNPNLWARSNRLGVYDQEQAFSFLSVPIVGGTPKPWSVATQSESFGFLKQHIFYHSLRGGPLNLGPFKEKLGALTEKQIRGYIDAVPAEWRGLGNFCGQVAAYLREARQQAEGLVNYIKHILR
jgi:hypothetical protein